MSCCVELWCSVLCCVCVVMCCVVCCVVLCGVVLCRKKKLKKNMFLRLGVRRLRKTRVQIESRRTRNFSSFNNNFSKTKKQHAPPRIGWLPLAGYAIGFTQHRRAGRLLAGGHDPVQELRAWVTPCSKKGERAPLGPAP